MRADQILPDHVDQIDLNGTMVRKGTVAAFLANARIWTDESASDEARAHAEADIVEGLSALRAIGFFDVVEIRDVSLRKWLDTH
ncbi:hypothetical protein PQQ96_02895 [Paraburkholderia sediminicola]|uniref:hypothetical protein n=1 Tax=Paraburkholderia sediminicola TaxID=458836 RepID=UPI0038B81DDE